jgi:Ferritin-like domain
MLANLSRRQSLQGLTLFGLGASIVAPIRPTRALAQPAPSDVKDEDIFQFALNLEYMEAEYYLRATTGKGIDAADVGSDPGAVKGGHKVNFQSKAVRQFAEELAENELAHVRASTARRWAARPSAVRRSISRPVSPRPPRARDFPLSIPSATT